MLEFKTLLEFAKDSVTCMAYFYKDSWVAPFGKVKSPFVDVMGEAIIRFSLYNREWLHTVAKEVVNRVDEHPEEFFKFGYEFADLLIENEPFLELLAICSLTTYIAHIFFTLGERHFMDKAYLMIAILFLKLRNKFEAKGGWKGFRQLCLEYTMMVINEGKIKQKNLTEEYPSSSEVYGKLHFDSSHSILMRSKSFGSLKNSSTTISMSTGFKAASTEAISKSSVMIPKSTGARIKSTVISQNSTSASRKSTRVISKRATKTSRSTGVLRKSIAVIPTSTTKTTGNAQKSTGAIPKSTSVTQKSTYELPKSSSITQESSGVISKSSDGAEKSVATSKSKSDKRRKKNRKSRALEPDLVLVTAHLIHEEPRRVGQKSIEKTPDSPKSNLTKDSPGPSTASQ